MSTRSLTLPLFFPLITLATASTGIAQSGGGISFEVTASPAEQDLNVSKIRLESEDEELEDTDSETERDPNLASLQQWVAFFNSLSYDESGNSAPNPSPSEEVAPTLPTASALAATAGATAYTCGRANTAIQKGAGVLDYAILATSDANGDPLTANAAGSLKVEMKINPGYTLVHSFGAVYSFAEGSAHQNTNPADWAGLLQFTDMLMGIVDAVPVIGDGVKQVLGDLISVNACFLKAAANFNAEVSLNGSSNSVNTGSAITFGIESNGELNPANDTDHGDSDYCALFDTDKGSYTADFAVACDSEAFGAGFRADAYAVVVDAWAVVMFMAVENDITNVISYRAEVIVGHGSFVGEATAGDPRLQAINAKISAFEGRLFQGRDEILDALGDSGITTHGNTSAARDQFSQLHQELRQLIK